MPKTVFVYKNALLSTAKGSQNNRYTVILVNGVVVFRNLLRIARP